MTYAQRIAAQISVKPTQVTAVIELLDEGNTIPFISRYRKERTGSLDEEQIRHISERLDSLRNLDQRRETILQSIEEQGQLNDELRARIMAAETLTTLEDLYLPYRPKRRTRATMARERGLQPLADLILAQARVSDSLEALAKPYISEEVPTTEDAWAGARDIVAETIADDAAVRGQVRMKALRGGILRSKVVKDADDPKTVYQTYYAFELRVDRLQPHQVLAVNRGETEKILSVSMDISERDWQMPVTTRFPIDRRSRLFEQLELAMEDCAKRLLLPAIERDVRRELTEKAEAHAIQVFAKNLRALLEQPPLLGRVVMGVDPAYRTGCKIAVIDETGKVLDTAAIFPHPPQKQIDQARATLNALIQKHHVSLIAIGNGTASRETESLIAEITREREDLHYLMVNEAGASVYSASPLARAELPDLDVTLRGAVSIARRVQDPLAEQVKIDPKSIGVGMYQHDVNQTQLADTLMGVVESVVNRVGVDVNTASPALLTYVAGIGPKLAEKIVAHRDSAGPFESRAALKSISGLGPKAFEQAAGFLRVRDGREPLDASAIHPESYKAAAQILKRAAVNFMTPPEEREASLQPLRAQANEIAAELSIGLPTLLDILDQIIRPGRDPREELPQPILRSDVLSMEDLYPGLQLNGTARNVVDFGVFVDIGVKQDGLLHRSQLPRGKTIHVGDILDVEILSVEIDRGRISLGLKQ